MRLGYGEYESDETYWAVECQNCHSKGRQYHQKHLASYTSHTVHDFRNNPVLRAKVEDKYDQYCAQTRQLAADAWNKRVEAE
jgi:hypothetical protein